MLIESKVRAEFESIWKAAGHPVRKARKFLAMSHRLTALAKHIANLGIRASNRESLASRPMLWASAAKFLDFAQLAREFARQALTGKPKPLGFGYRPQAFATPNWDMGRDPSSQEAAK